MSHAIITTGVSTGTWANIGYSISDTSHSLTVCVDIKQCANFD
ncbi:hypothetical protein PE36_13869 [Moritella sp. PE36]|nr:hypothetical protein PE36_13869 [Moritella sp. PE36]